VKRAGELSYVLGVDGGNTKTIALVARTDGTVVGAARAGCSDIYGAASAEAALHELDAAVTGALGMAGIGAAELAAGAFSLAGADWPEDIQFLEDAVEQRGYGRRLLVVNDALGALRAGSANGGVAVVCGTGAAIGARSPDGRVWHTSWWQEPQGSRHLAEKMLRAVYRSELGIDPPTALTRRVLQIFDLATVEEVLHALTARQRRVACDHAVLTAALLEEAARGDETAHCIVTDHGRALGEYALAAAREVGLQRSAFAVVLAGGVLRESTVLAEAIVERVRSDNPHVRPVAVRVEPAVGAVLLALEEIGVTAGESVRQAVARGVV
jgi:N-acetylglucosamine kinase-like BadF-type ATPase